MNQYCIARSHIGYIAWDQNESNQSGFTNKIQFVFVYKPVNSTSIMHRVEIAIQHIKHVINLFDLSVVCHICHTSIITEPSATPPCKFVSPVQK